MLWQALSFTGNMLINLCLFCLQGSAVFDFAGTGYESYGNCNAPRAVALSALIYCLRSMVKYDIPLNQVQSVVLSNSFSTYRISPWVDFHKVLRPRFRYVTYEGLFQLAARQFYRPKNGSVNKLQPRPIRVEISNKLSFKCKSMLLHTTFLSRRGHIMWTVNEAPGCILCSSNAEDTPRF